MLMNVSTIIQLVISFLCQAFYTFYRCLRTFKKIIRELTMKRNFELTVINDSTMKQVGGHSKVIFGEDFIGKTLSEDEYRFYLEFQNEIETLNRSQREIPNEKEEADIILSEIIPKFIGKKKISECLNSGQEKIEKNDNKEEILMLENLTKGFKKPCILDCKLGNEGYAKSHVASIAKINKKIWGYYVTNSSTSKKLGFRISGMNTLKDLQSGKMQKLSKLQGRQLNEKKSEEVMRTFFSYPNDSLLENGTKTGIRTDILSNALKELDKILRFFELQKEFSFFSSSILFVYDGANLQSNLIRVKLIDFGHWFRENKSDSSSLAGVRSIHQILLSLLSNTNSYSKAKDSYDTLNNNQNRFINLNTKISKKMEPIL